MYVVACCCLLLLQYKKMCTALLRFGLGCGAEDPRSMSHSTPPLPLLPLLPLQQQACSQPKAAAGWYYILYTSNAQLTLMLKAWMGGSFEKICITVSFELGIIRITGACHLLCCVAFDLLYSAYLQSLCNILLVLLSLIHVNVIEILEEATATETDCCSCWQDGSNNVAARYLHSTTGFL